MIYYYTYQAPSNETVFLQNQKEQIKRQLAQEIVSTVN
jgi:hypothetical protein